MLINLPMKSHPTETLNKISTADLQQRIDRLYNHLYANAPVRTPAGIANEVGKILHTAIYIEEMTVKANGPSPAFLFQSYHLKRIFQSDQSLCEEVAKSVRDNFSKMNKGWGLYPGEEQILLSDSDIGFTCGQLSGVVVSDRNRDVFGDALEIFRGQWAKREGGQFFTDQRVTSLALALLDFDPRKGDDLVDICAGTGGFLLAGLNRIRALLEADSPEGGVETELLAFASSSLKGQEVDAEVGEIANATLKSRLSSVARPFVAIGDSLNPSAFDSAHKRIRYNSHLCAATNPPFGTKITVKDINILSSYELARTQQRPTASALFEGAAKVSNRAPDTLFIEQNVKLLKPGAGRLAIIVPYQILSGPQTLYIREWLLRHTDIVASIDLPADTFQPHTGTKAGLLVVRRREEPLSDISKAADHDIFMSMPRWIGHDRRGNPVYKKLKDGTHTGEILSDFDGAERAFWAFQRGEIPSKEHPESFKLKLSDILADSNLHLNALFYRRHGQVNRQIKKESKEWRYVKVRDVVERIFYPTRFKREYVDYYEGAVPFLGGSNISQMIITTDKWLRHDNPNLESLKVRAGWILITRSGSTGIVSSVPPAWDGYAMSEHIIRIVPNHEKLDSHYLQAFLRTPYAQDIISRGVFGSVIDEITPEYIGEMEIPVPRSDVTMKRVVSMMKKAEAARNTAIETLTETVDDLNQELQGNQARRSDDAARSAP